MQIENSFTVDAPIDAAWTLLTDIPAIAPCMPGATLTDETDGVYTGSVKVKVGPITAQYKGSAEFVERDDANHSAVISGKGRDTRGAGNAEALISATLREISATQTQVDISTELKITGKVAQFGRGVMQDVSEKLLGQFAECLAGKLDVDDAPEDEAEAEAEETVATEAASEESAPEEPQEAEAIDILDVAGDAMAKRLVPALIAAIVLVVLVRRWRRR